MDVPPLGTIVTVPQGQGVIRFSGPTSFSSGKWVGIELYDGNGKNDGSVNGVPYFTCKKNYGVFVRPSQIKSTHGSEIEATRSRSRAGTVSQTPATPADNLRASSSIRPPASPRSNSPSKLPPGPQRTALAKPTPSKRNSLTLGTLQPQPRKSFPTAGSSPATSHGSSPVPPPSPTRGIGLGITSPPSVATTSKRTVSPLTKTPPKLTSTAPAKVTISAAHRPTPSTSTPPVSYPAAQSGVARPPSSAARPPSSARVRPPSQASSVRSVEPSPQVQLTQVPPVPVATDEDLQELERLRGRVQQLELKRSEDQRHITELENRLEEAKAFASIRPKLQARLTSLNTELGETKRELNEALQLKNVQEQRVVDVQDMLEMTMLDKEVAEEKAEIVEAELEEMKEKMAQLQVEIEVLRGGGGDGDGEGEGKIKNTLAYIQLEKHNERLKEALIKLRDMSQETDHEQRKRISEMERDVASLDELQANYEETLIKLSNAEIQIEDLKLQLDDAFTAEEMLVQLTERNLMLGEKIEEMRITIEDLEALKELNDELEENHVETEKQLNEDLNQKDMQIREQVQRNADLEDTCQDLENTINQFRELVLQLQQELEDLRTQTQTAQNESASAASQTAAIMSMNLKLQSSASKNQARNIELEIRKIEARESKELLGIVQPYLPQIYVESDSDATSCYLFFQRLGYKADLINTVVAQAHGIPESLQGSSVSDVLVGICEMRARISALSITCKRFATVLRKCDAEAFLNVGRIYPEIAPMEKRIDMHIDLLRRDEFRERECVSDIDKIQLQFDHIAETYFTGYDFDLGERELGYALSFDHDVDMFIASIGLAKTSVSSVLNDEDVVLDMGGYDIDEELFNPLQGLLDQCKGAKALSKKLTKRLSELIGDSGAVKASLLTQMKDLSNSAAEIVNFGISLAQGFMPHISDARSAKSSFQLTTLLGLVKQTAVSTVAKNLKPTESAWDAIGASISQIVQDGGKLLPLVLETENVVKISGTSPWVARVDEIKAALAVNVEAERKVAQLNDEMQGLVRTLRSKDQNIQEAAVKIELMERRMETVKKQADQIADLENELVKAHKQEKAYEEAMEQLQTDLDALEQDNAKLKTMTAGQEKQAPAGIQQLEAELPSEANLETSYLLEQIEALRGTVRFLRNENSYLKGQDLQRELDSLPPLREPASRLPTPELVPSHSDSDDSDSELDSPRPPPTLRSLATETKQLYRDVLKFSSSPKVVSLASLNARRADGKGGKGWMPKKQTPAYQVWERKQEAEKLSRRVQGLLDRASMIRNL